VLDRPAGNLLRVPRDSSLVPRDKFDLDAAQRAIAAGRPAVEPVLGELVGWCVDSNWPVARALGPFLGALGSPVIPAVREVLDGDDATAKYHVLVIVVASMPAAARAELGCVLSRLARSLDPAELAEGVPEVAAELLGDARARR
jgi:hypothetical protein